MNTNRFKGFWSKFTTRFAVPVLIFSQIVTLYDGWESRIEETAYQKELISCIRTHRHYTPQDTMVTLDDSGETITATEFFKDSPEMDQTGETYWPQGCGMFDVNTVQSEYTPERTMDRWLGRVFWAYKNNKDKLVEWINHMFMKKATEHMRG